MTKIIDLVDQTSGDRRISSIIQAQNGFQPKIEITATVFGDANPTICGMGSFQIYFYWSDAHKIPELSSILESIESEQVNQYSKFRFLVNEKDESIGNNCHLIKITNGNPGPEYLSLYINVTVNELHRLAESENIQCDLDNFKFELSKLTREPFGKIASLVSNIKTVEETYHKELGVKNQNFNHCLTTETVKPSLNWGPVIGLFILVSMFSIFVFKNFKSQNQQNYSNDHSSKQLQACINRGIAYFQEIGSYPTLKTPPHEGDLAENVARERCNRTTTAF